MDTNDQMAELYRQDVQTLIDDLQKYEVTDWTLRDTLRMKLEDESVKVACTPIINGAEWWNLDHPQYGCIWVVYRKGAAQ